MLHRGHGLTTAFKVRHSRLLTCLDIGSTGGARRHISGASHDIAILGGGITGLACAYYITRELPRAKVTIYEASDRIGGWLSSKRVPVKDGTILFEAGPRTLRPSTSNGILAVRLLQELDLARDAIFPQRTSPAARNRFVYYPDHLVRMPHPAFGLIENFNNLWSEPAFEGAIWAGFSELFRDERKASVQDESVGEFFSRRLNKKVVDRLLSAVLHGIYAGDAWQLSAKSLFPRPWRDEVTAGSIIGGILKSRTDGIEVSQHEAEYLLEMKPYGWEPLLSETIKHSTAFTFKDGLGMITEKLARWLTQIGTVEFKTATPVEAIAPTEDKTKILVTAKGSQEPTKHDHVISTLSPFHFNMLHHGQSGNLVPHIPSVTVMTVNLYYRTPDLNPAGFGYVIPQATPFENNPERALGVVFDTAYSPFPKDSDPNNWRSAGEVLKHAQSEGLLINIDDFAWHNMPNKPNVQDDVKERGTKLTVMLGGHWWDGWPQYPDEKEGLALAKSLLERHLGIKEEPEAWQVNLQRDCIPQYTVGHEQRLKQAHNNIWREYKGSLRVAGSWMSGVGVNDCLRSAWDVVRSLRDAKYGTGLEQVGTNEYVRLKPGVPVRGES